MAEPEEITPDDLRYIFIRAQNEAGRWENVSIAEATDAQFWTWASSKMTIQGNEGEPWSQQERLDFCNQVHKHIHPLAMVKREVRASFDRMQEGLPPH